MIGLVFGEAGLIPDRAWKSFCEAKDKRILGDLTISCLFDGVDEKAPVDEAKDVKRGVCSPLLASALLTSALDIKEDVEGVEYSCSSAPPPRGRTNTSDCAREGYIDACVDAGEVDGEPM